MDAAQRRRLLFEKATANQQRRHREGVLSRLQSHISHVLANSPCVYSVEIDPILRRFLPFNRSGVGGVGFIPAHYDYTEVAWESKLIAHLSRLIVPQPAGNAILLLNAPSEVHFEGQAFYLPDAPLFVVDFRWAATLLNDLWNSCTGQLFLVAEDLRAGILVSNYVGYLPNDPNPREIVYEVALWPSESDDSVPIL